MTTPKTLVDCARCTGTGRVYRLTEQKISVTAPEELCDVCGGSGKVKLDPNKVPADAQQKADEPQQDHSGFGLYLLEGNPDDESPWVKKIFLPESPFPGDRFEIVNRSSAPLDVELDGHVVTARSEYRLKCEFDKADGVLTITEFARSEHEMALRKALADSYRHLRRSCPAAARLAYLINRESAGLFREFCGSG